MYKYSIARAPRFVEYIRQLFIILSNIFSKAYTLLLSLVVSSTHSRSSRSAVAVRPR